MNQQQADALYFKFLEFADLPALPSNILDFGAGDGRHSKTCSVRGHRVTAVDVKDRPSHVDANVSWHKSDVLKFAQEAKTAQYDAVIAVNIIQFLPASDVRDIVVPFFHSCLRPGGMLMLQTFTRLPKPTTCVDFLSFWHTNDLVEMFSGFSPTEYVEEYDRDGKTYDGSRAHFWLADFVAVRK